MKEIIHFPYGVDDPYIIKRGIERLPREPLSGESVEIHFITDPGELGQRAWVEVETPIGNTTVRAQFQDSEGTRTFWKAIIKPENMGTTVKYRIGTGRGYKSAVYSPWHVYTVKEWISAENMISFEENVIFLDKDVERKAVIPGLVKTEILTDGERKFDLRLTFKRKSDEVYYGFGEHYDKLEYNPGDKHIVHVYDQCKVQKERAYAPVPFFFSNKGFGLLADTGFMTEYDFTDNTISVTVHTLDSSPNNVKFRLWNDSAPQNIISDFYKIVNPEVPPVWAFGPWLSANQWNSQKKVEEVLKKSVELDLPATVLVVEAWSDEQSFYIFNGAEYKPVDGSDSLSLNNFSFKDPWPDPKGLIEALHEKGIKFILWQIPVLKNVDNCIEQHEKDIEFARKNGYVVKKDDGSNYEIIPGRWFDGSNVVDFFNEEASKWWASKRKYLVDEMGVDGFKTDGGEHLWGRDTVVADGKTAAEARNLYPERYLKTAKSVAGKDGILFSRSGYINSPSSSIFWVGDEDSNFEALRDNLTAGLNVSLAGNPFWGWDIAGFSGELPSGELYIRSLQNAIFTPVFQFHSENPGDPVPSAERSPWNMAVQCNNDKIIDIYREYVSLRMALSPYIYNEAKHCACSGTPLTMPLYILDNRNPVDSLAYYFGRDLVVYPVVDENVTEGTIYLPEGKWMDLWTGEWFEGNKEIKLTLSEKYIPVFVKKNAVIPLSLNEKKDLLAPNWSQEQNAVLFATDENISVEQLRNIIADHSEENIKFAGMSTNKVNNSGIVSIDWHEI